MGTVYLALASGLGQFRKLLVVKELRRELTRQQGFITMFMDEAKLAARLDHPNVVQTFEATQDNDRYFLAMEYLDGQPLSALIDRTSDSDGLPLWVHIQILCEVLSGLHYAHELLDYDGSLLHVVHRDVSPQNVFVTYHGQVKVVDFGVAKAADASTLTDPGVFKGKFAYAAPEQVLGRPIDARTDIFAVGIMLWQAIAGQRFSDQVATPAAFRARAAGAEPRIRDVMPNVDPVLASICDRALSIDPDQRFNTAQEFRSELQDYLMLQGVRVEAPEIGQFMRDAFDQERRATHLLIEQAMKNSGASDSSVEALPFLHIGDKEPTAVADLSSLVDVSVEREDHKIRRGYAHSKVTLKKRPDAPPPAGPTGRTGSGANRMLIVSVALSGMCLASVAVMLLSQRHPAADAKPAAAAAGSLHAVDTTAPAAPSPTPVNTAVVANAAPGSAAPGVGSADAANAHPAAGAVNAVPTPTPASAAPEPKATVRAVAPSQPARPQPPVARHGRGRSGTSDGAARSDAPAVSESAPVANPRQAAPDVGTDLRSTRRGADPRIDMEDPYR
jgi:serine/threonine-protein kinase